MSTSAAAFSVSLPFSISNKSSNKTVRGGLPVFAIIGEGGRLSKRAARFNIENQLPEHKRKFPDFLEVAKDDIQFCTQKARQDVLTIVLFHDKLVETLNPLARELKSTWAQKKGLVSYQEEVTQVHIPEACVNDKVPQEEHAKKSNLSLPTSTWKNRQPGEGINVSGPVKPYHTCLKNFWYPVAFSADLKSQTMVPIDCFEEPWVLFRGEDGKPGCVQNTCAHRACPLHLGSVNQGRIQCPYHGWEYSTDGKCEKMPSTRLLNIKIRALPCSEQEGMIWIWPGDDPPAPIPPSVLPSSDFRIHAEIVMELPVEHGLLLDNLLDLAHAPFTHSLTFAKGWSIPSLVKFLTPVSGLQGNWEPYPIDMEFRPPCMVLSTIGLSKPGKLVGHSTRECATHLHQLHVSFPSSRKKTRLMYRMSLNFAPMLKHIPFMQHLWRHFAEKVLNEDLRLIIGQQERMLNGANVWNWPVPYDKLGIRYRLWRDSVEH